MPKHWNCFVSGCEINHRSTSATNVKYYRIPKSLQSKYNAFFKTDDVDLSKALICSRHWSRPELRAGKCGFKIFPDIKIPTLPKKPKTSRSKGTPYEKAQIRHKGRNKENDKLKLEITALEETCSGKDVVIEGLTQKIKELEAQTAVQSHETNELKKTLCGIEEQLQNAESKAQQATEMLEIIRSSQSSRFSHQDLDEVRFRYLTGFSKDAFATLFELFEPYLDNLTYTGCKHTFHLERKLTKATELFCVFMMLRHGLEAGIVAWITNVSSTTMNTIFVAWIIFGSALFSQLNLTHPKTLLQACMPTSFLQNGYSHTVLILDATEFKLTNFSDLQLNCIFFSDYKNTHTAKALIGITPHGSLSHLPDLYPGSVTDNDITIVTGVLDTVQKDDCVLVDKGFGIAEHAAEKGAVVNRPPMASSDQFTPGEVEANFKIAHLRIHVERWIGRLRNFAILNKVWHASRLDLLNETVKFCGHILNITDVVGPTEPV